MNKKQIQKRLDFLETYREFDNWLYSIGFRKAHYWNESGSSSDHHYSHYDKVIDSLYSVEHYVHDILKLSLRFLRDRNEHKFVLVGKFGAHSSPMTLEQFKGYIIFEVKAIRDERIKELQSLANI